MSDWQPIETAPKDGTYVIVASIAPKSPSGWAVGEAYFRDPETHDNDNDCGWWWGNTSPGDYYAEKIWNEPTHWQPMPNPPSTPDTLGD